MLVTFKLYSAKTTSNQDEVFPPQRMLEDLQDLKGDVFFYAVFISCL